MSLFDFLEIFYKPLFLHEEEEEIQTIYYLDT